MASTWRILEGDVRKRLAGLDAGSVQTCVTSPPYFGLRDYGTGAWEGGEASCDHGAGRVAQRQAGRQTDLGGGTPGSLRDPVRVVCECGAQRVDRQIGLEPTPDEFVAALVEVFREVRRVLRDDGTVWLNLGDSYNGNPSSGGIRIARDGDKNPGEHQRTPDSGRRAWGGAKPKDLLGIPWMVAFALRADGWYLRSDIIWSKPNPMPESVTDRPTKAHEYVFLLSKRPRYFYDADAIREQHSTAPLYDAGRPDDPKGHPNGHGGHVDKGGSHRVPGAYHEAGRNKRTVWTVATQPFPGAHFATFPPKLIEPCILAGSSPKACGECGAPWRRVVERTKMVTRPTPKREKWQAEDDHARTQAGGTMLEPPTSKTVGWESACDHSDDTGRCVVLDPFSGSGTTGMVALRHDRSYVGCELNSEYVALSRERIIGDSPMLNTHAERT